MLVFSILIVSIEYMKVKMTIDTLAQMVAAGFDSVGSNMATKKELHEFRVEVNERFDVVDKRFDHVERQLDTIEHIVLDDHGQRI